MSRWRVALLFEIEAESEEQAWERGDDMVAKDDLAMYDAEFVSCEPHSEVTNE